MREDAALVEGVEVAVHELRQAHVGLGLGLREGGRGAYLNPPEHARVLSCHEKSQIQILIRKQPGLPMKRGRAGTVTHD